MKINRKYIAVRDLVENYHEDNASGQVRGYGDRLDIRPPFQREFVYDNNQAAAVIETVMADFPLNVMYWGVRDDGTYEVIDGQQRTISLAHYVKGKFSVDGRGFANLQDDERERILGYELHVYFCEGEASEKLAWFETINIAGERLTRQELLNAVFAGPWVSDAKRHFSRPGGPAYAVGKDYVSGKPIRQDYLETAIRWHKDEGQSVKEHMAAHQHDPTATALWQHFRAVIDRATALFPNYRREMKGVDWGSLYGVMSDESLDPAELEKEVADLMRDEDVTSKKGIYPYVLTGDEHHLNVRAFSPAMRREAYERQGGKCADTGEACDIKDMHADHIIPWSKGGKTEGPNCRMVKGIVNLRKSNK